MCVCGVGGGSFCNLLAEFPLVFCVGEWVELLSKDDPNNRI